MQNVLTSGDDLTIVTPLKTYKMRDETLRSMPKDRITTQLKEILRKDAWIGNSEYRNAVKDLEGVVRSLSSAFLEIPDITESAVSGYEGMDIDEKLQVYDVLLNKLESLRKIDQKGLLDFADFLKDTKGQKNVFLFYQREFIPQIEPRIFDNMITMNQDNPAIQLTGASLMDFFKRDISFNVDVVKQAYANSSIAIHFLYFTKVPKYIPGIRMEEHSEDVFGAFNEISQATGGYAGSSSNPKFLFKQASDASENYYLLYYTPKDYTPDGKFREIDVKVKNAKYKIFHRAGYISD